MKTQKITKKARKKNRKPRKKKKKKHVVWRLKTRFVRIVFAYYPDCFVICVPGEFYCKRCVEVWSWMASGFRVLGFWFSWAIS